MLAANKPIRRSLVVLKKTSDFQKIQKQGMRYKPVSWLILNFAENDLNHFRCGWTVSRKVGSAVIRNKLKRWSRVFFRKTFADLALDVNLVFLQRDDGFYRNLKYREFEFVMQKGQKHLQNYCAKSPKDKPNEKLEKLEKLEKPEKQAK